MKIRLLLVIMLLGSFSGYCQTGNPFNYTQEVNRMGNTPNSPGAQAFAQYGNIPVNLLVGSPDVSVPLYVYKGREMNLPISLTYDINNRKVEDIASSIGLGWNLNLGGRVSRIVNGLPDDYTVTAGMVGHDYQTLANNTSIRETYYDDYKGYFFDHTVHPNIDPDINFYDEQEAKDYFKFLYDIDRGAIDMSLDNFSINALGLNEHIVLEEEDLDAIPQNNPRITVDYTRNPNNFSVTGWTVTDEYGNKYKFEKPEKTHRQNYNDNGVTLTFKIIYASSWLLTEITSTNGKDIYEFEYDNQGYWQQPVFVRSMHAVNYGNDPQRHDFELGDHYYIEQQFIKQVKHNGKVIVLINKGNRDDLDIDNSAIKSITIKNPIDGNTVNHFQFDQSYFGNSVENEIEELRLKLDTVKIAGSDYDGSSNYEFKKKYSFSYDREEQMPTRKTFAQDILGFYNGHVANDALEGTVENPWGLLIPEVVIENDNGPNTTFMGADRGFSEDKSKIGILTQINYPTGGFNFFKYESNQESHWEDITETYFSFYDFVESDSGDFDSNQCGPCCMDDTEPKNAETHLIELPQNDDYAIEFIVSEDTGDDKRAYILGPFQNNDTVYTYENICNNLITPLHIYSGNSLEEDLNLQAGSYQVILFNADQDDNNCANTGDCTRVTLKIRGENVTGQELVHTKYPGLRIKSISSFTDDDEIATKKTFTYSNFTENYKPKLYYTTESGFVKHRLSKAMTSSYPYITYGTVEETNVIPLSEISQDGKIVHQFYNDPLELKGSVPQISPPFAVDYYGNVKKGVKKKQLVYNNDQELLSEAEFLFTEDEGNEMKGSLIQDADANKMKIIQLYDQGSDVRFRFIDASFDNNGGIILPPACDDGGCLQYYANARLKPIYSYSRPQFLKEQQSNTAQYFNGIASNQTSIIKFDPNLDYLPSESSTTTSKDNKIIITEYSSYLNDYAIPEEVKIYQKTGTAPKELLSTRQTIFQANTLPEKIKTAIRNENLETKITYAYNSFGNVVDVTNGDSHSSMIWGYNEQYPVVKLSNLAYSSIPSNLITAIKGASDDNGYDEINLITAIDNLRLALPGVQITSYIYIPSIGVKTITDPRGDKVNFEYDSLNRLKYVIDKDDNRLSENQYNYRINN